VRIVQPPAERMPEVFAACVQGFGVTRFSDDTAAREATVWEVDRTWVAEDDDGRYVATATSYSFDMTLPGNARVPAAGVAQVAVLPTHRRRGLLRQVMAALLADVAERGEPFAILNASETGIYGRFGFGSADRVLRIELDTDHVVLAGPVAPGDVRLVDAKEAGPLLADLYERWGRRRPGTVSRSDAWWALMLHETASWRGGGDPFVAVHHEPGGEPDGYAVYRSIEEWRRGHPSGRVEVRELEAATSEAEAALWRFLCDLDLRTRVVAYPRPLDDPLAWRLTQPRRAWITTATDLLWVRPVDVAVAMGDRRYAIEDELVLEVADASRPDQAGTYRVGGGPDGAECGRVDTAADLRLDVSVVGSLALGGIDAGEMGAAGRITEVTPGALARADRFFRWRPAPFCSTTF
jgi:predicted acetyltransferase